jgi:hypothetical protein
MLLSIDRVLQLLKDGKSIEKIAELAETNIETVIDLIDQAREIINRRDPSKSRKKIKIKKNFLKNNSENQLYNTDELFKGADLTVVPIEDYLQFNIAAKKIEHAIAIGIIINDGQNRQVGNLHYNSSGEKIEPVLAEAMTRCEKISDYFNSKKIRIKIDDEYVYNMYTGNVSTILSECKKHFNDLKNAALKYEEASVELIEKHHNEKAAFLLERTE